jgi:hypothetical protein
MNFVKVPNMPKGPVGLVIIDGRIDSEIENTLVQKGIKVFKTSAHIDVYDAVSHHPDIMIHHLGDEHIVYAPGTCEYLLDKLRKSGFALLKGGTRLGSAYPENVAYNVARVGNVAFHNFKYTDPVLKNELVRRGVELVNVKQGYSKCSISIVDEASIITADKGIAKAAEANGIEVLLIGSEEKIELPGLSCGFIGGCTGLINKNEWAITGDIINLASANNINEFLERRGVKIVPLSKKSVIDVGTIIPLCEC